MKSVLALGLLLSVTACGSMSESQRMATAAEDRNRCISIYGFKPDSEGLAHCMLQLDVIRSEQDFNRRQALAAGLRQMGESMQRRSVNCNTYGTANTFGSTTTVNTNTSCR